MIDRDSMIFQTLRVFGLYLQNFLNNDPDWPLFLQEVLFITSRLATLRSKKSIPTSCIPAGGGINPPFQI